MLVKELDRPESTDPLGKAGQRAEAQLAHYLCRAFERSEDLFLFHDLRLEREGDAAQIDHLLLHRHGVILIESKSVTTQVRVNEHREWCRWFRGQERGMPSPIEQARRQGEFLRIALESYRETLLEKFLGRQGSFGRMPIDVLVAISDEGVIRRPRGLQLPEVLKADQVPARVQELLREYRRINGLWNLRESGYEFRRLELERITTFLLAQHRPHRRDIPAAPAINKSLTTGPAPAPIAEIAKEPATVLVAAAIELPGNSPSISAAHCPECGRTSRRIEYGRYGYYWKCENCSGTTAIRYRCERCGNRGKIRKAGLQFFAECCPCQTSHPYFANPG